MVKQSVVDAEIRYLEEQERAELQRKEEALQRELAEVLAEDAKRRAYHEAELQKVWASQARWRKVREVLSTLGAATVSTLAVIGALAIGRWLLG